MFHSRALAFLLATVSLLAGLSAHAQIGIEPLADQDIPSGKTLVVPIPATDPGGPARTYTVTVGTPTTSGSATTVAGINAVIRTGDPHFIVNVTYTDSNSQPQSGTMEFQLLREFTPVTAQIIGGLAEGGFYNPRVSVSGTSYVPFHRIVPGFVIQGGDPTGTGTGGPGFTFHNEYNGALVFSGSAGQLAMANSGYGVAISSTTIITGTASESGTTVVTGSTTGIVVDEDSNGTNGSQFFVTLASNRTALDFKYNLFGQMVRGFDTLFGIAGTPLETNTSSGEFSEPINPVDITSAAVTQNNTDAVLLLSATGVCSATVTVTASSGTETATQSFTANAQADTVNDPAFPRLVPDTTAPNGGANVPLMGTDLQLDLLRYGYERILPVTDVEAVTGTSPVVTVPLISNTDNVVASTLDQWNDQAITYFGEGNDSAQPNIRVFHIGAGDKPIRGTLAPIPAGSNGMLALDPYAVATFTTANKSDTAASFTASVNWGDATLLSGTPNVMVVADGSASTMRRYKLMAGHTYTMPGEYPVIVKVSDPGGAYLILTGTANVGAGSIGLTPTDIYRAGGILKNQVVATFTDTQAGGTASDYSANIDWGDGAITPGTVKAVKKAFQVLGTHTYASPAQFSVSTTVTRSGTDSGSCWATASISGVNAPQVFPPFPQAHLAQVWSPLVTSSNAISNSGAMGDGGNPQAPLVAGTDGNYYGTTTAGGASGKGTIYRISTSGSESVLYSFTGAGDGGKPIGGLLSATDGIFYGTTELDGTTEVSGSSAAGFGTIFQYSATSGSLTTLYTFTGGSDGGEPMCTLIQGTDGNLYGTTETDGINGFGTVFQYVLSSGSLNTIHSFVNSTDGGNPQAGVIQGNDGNLYGATEEGASSGVIQASDDNLYGTTLSGGGFAAGTVFQISTTGTGYNVIYSFSGGAHDGGLPKANPIQGADGNLYGTASTAGGGSGTVYELSTSGSFNELYEFTGGSDGAVPSAALVEDTSSGIFYGTTFSGGTGGTGTVFGITASGSNSFQVLHEFSGGTGNTFQIGMSCSVMIVNSGNNTSSAGSFSVYVDPNGELDGNQTAFTENGQSVFPIPALKPGQSTTFTFKLEGTAFNTQLQLPTAFNPSGQTIIGVVTYSDPVANFDGASKIFSPGSF